MAPKERVNPSDGDETRHTEREGTEERESERRALSEWDTRLSSQARELRDTDMVQRGQAGAIGLLVCCTNRRWM